MASIISAGTTSGTALNMSGDTTGNLAFTTQAGTYTQTVPNVTGNIVTTGDTGTVTKSMISTSTSTGFGLCRAWVQFAGASGTIAGSYNISSVTRTATGKYTINFTTAMASTNYAACIGNGGAGGYYGVFVSISSYSTSSINLSSIGSATGAFADADPQTVCLAILSS